MTRRSLIAFAAAVAAFGPVSTGCGLVLRRFEGEPLIAVGAVARDFSQSSHRVALAASEAMHAELASIEAAGESEFFASPDLVKADGTKPRPGELSPDYPGFWLELDINGEKSRDLMTLSAYHASGKTRDGRPVQVRVGLRSQGSRVTVHVDKLGDRDFSDKLLDRIADRLAHPTHPPGSPEEAEAFQAFFGKHSVPREVPPAIGGGAEGK